MVVVVVVMCRRSGGGGGSRGHRGIDCFDILESIPVRDSIHPTRLVSRLGIGKASVIQPRVSSCQEHDGYLHEHM